MSKIDIYVINLDKDKKRLQKMIKNTKDKNINIIRYPAILGKEINQQDSIFKKYMSNNFTHVFNREATIGCVLSHVTLYDKLYNKYKDDTSKKYFIICEDDALLINNFSNKLHIILSELPDDWDFVYLGINHGIGHKYSENLIKPDFKSGNWGFFGYMISQSCLSKLNKYCKNINMPIDNFLKNKNINYFMCNPPLITHDFDNFSNITHKNRKNDINHKIVVL